jgi:molecular chaperone GrpE
MRDSNSAEPQSVLEVVQRGYELNGRLLRPARVIVARPPEST